MQIRCPHCHNPIEVVDDDLLTDISCPDCGSNFSLISGETISYAPGAVKTIGHFELLENLGGGHFGTVWKARDTKLDRTVAVKIPRRGQIEGPEAEMFLREARAAAQVKHPGVVGVHEVGREGDTLYIVSDFINGCSLKEWLSGRQLAPREAAELCAKIADALHAAHEAGVVHRDLKPGNVMMDMAGEPHLTDFGLAKREANEITMTVDGQVLGTPAYMSPEQARGEAHKADRRSDVYSLGVILFELLTGELPFRGSQRMMIVQILQDDPPSPRKLQTRITRDLETICLKCLEKDPGKRYPTAAEVADELRRHLQGEPIHARPVGRTEWFWRWCKREPIVAGLSVAAGMFLLLVAIVASVGYSTTSKALTGEKAARKEADFEKDRAKEQQKIADKQKKIAEEKQEESERNLYGTRISLAHQNWLASEVEEAERQLDACPSRFRAWEWGYLKRLCHLDLRTFRGHSSGIQCVSFSPDGKRVASASQDDMVKIWDLQSDQEMLTLCGHTGSDQFYHCMSFSPDGKYVALGSKNSTVEIWDVESGKLLFALRGHTNEVTSVSFSPDSKRLASGDYDATVKIWDTQSGKELRELKEVDCVWRISFSPDGKHLAISAADGKTKIWDAESGQVLLTIQNCLGPLSFSPDGKRLAVADEDAVKLWDTQDGQELSTLRGHSNSVNCVSFSPDGNHLASGSSDRTVKIWDAQNGEELLTLRGHRDSVNSLSFSPDGKRLASGSEDQTLKIWDAENSQESVTWQGFNDMSDAGLLSPDSKRLACVYNSSVIALDVETGEELSSWYEPDKRFVRLLAFSPDGKLLASGDDEHTIKLCEVETGKELFALRERTKVASKDRPKNNDQFSDSHSADGLDGVPGMSGSNLSNGLAAAFSPDGKRLATGSSDGTVKILDVQTGKELSTLHGRGDSDAIETFSPDGKRLVLCDRLSAVVLDVQSGRELLSLDDCSYIVSYSHDGKRLCFVSSDLNSVKICDAQNGQELLSLRGHTNSILCGSFSPDGKRLVTGSHDHTVKIWDSQNGHELLTFRVNPYSWIDRVSFSPDGKRLAAVSRNRFQFWDAWTEEEAKKCQSKILPPPSVSLTNWIISQWWNSGALTDIKKLGGKLLVHGAKASWSPDGKRFIYGKLPFGEGLQVYHLSTGKITDIISPGKDPAWSPGEGRWIAYVRGDIPDEEIWLVDENGQGAKKITDGGFPSWSPDGKTVFFHNRKDRKIMAINVEESGANPREIMDSIDSYYPAVSPNSSQVAFIAGNQLTIMEVGTKKILMKEDLYWDDGLVSWSPDGGKVGFGSYGGNNNQGLWIYDVKNGSRKNVALGGCTMPAWSPDGSQLAFDMRSGDKIDIWMIETRALDMKKQAEKEIDSTLPEK